MAKRILIADDDLELAQNLTVFLENAGYEVDRRDNVVNIEEDLLADTPDLLVLDVMFPRNASGGFNAARLIRGKKELENLPIILLTGVNQECPVDFSTEDIDPDWMPVQDFCEKPFQPEEIIAKVEKMLD